MKNVDIRPELGGIFALKLVEKVNLNGHVNVKRIKETQYPRRYLDWTPANRRSIERTKKKMDGWSKRGSEEDWRNGWNWKENQKV